MRTNREFYLMALTSFFFGAFASLAGVVFSGNVGRVNMYVQTAVLGGLLVLSLGSFIVFMLVPPTETDPPTDTRQSKSTAPPATSPPASSPTLVEQERKHDIPRVAPPIQERKSSHGGSPSHGESYWTPTPTTNEMASVAKTQKEYGADDPVSTNSPGLATPHSTAAPGRLVEIWESYRSAGDQKFTVEGMKRRLTAAGIGAEVLPGEQVGAGANVLIVDLRGGGSLVYLLPNFDKPVRSVSQWFQCLGSESRTAVIQRLVRPATARRSQGTLDLVTKGEIE